MDDPLIEVDVKRAIQKLGIAGGLAASYAAGYNTDKKPAPTPRPAARQPASQPVRAPNKPPVAPRPKGGISRGIRNNNPGNIVYINGVLWRGQDNPPSDGRFVRFTSPVWGIRALAKVLQTYQLKYNLRSIDAIISRYAPRGENDTKGYIRSVANQTGYDAHQELDLVGNKQQLMRVIRAVIAHENGAMPYDDDTILHAIDSI